MREPRAGGILSDPDGHMRWAWRVLLFVALVFAIAAVLSPVAGRLVGRGSSDAELIARGLAVAIPAALIASWVMMSCVESRSLAALGLVPARLLPDAGLGILIGLVLVGSVVGLLALTGSLEWSVEAGAVAALPGWFGRMCLILGLAALLEEVLFRGYVFQVLGESFGAPSAIGVTSLVFGAAHLPNPGVGGLALINTALAGILLGVAYWRTFSIWLVTAIHFAWNGAMSLAADLPVSGLDLDAPGIRASVSGPEIWTGGSYGPEGGLALTLMTLTGLAWAIRSPWLRRSPKILVHHPLPGVRLT